MVTKTAFKNIYKKLDQEDIDFLAAVAGKENVFVGKDIHQDFCHDELSSISSMPEVLVVAAGTKQISNIMKYAYSKTIPVVARGSGTGLVGGAVPIYGGILIDMSKMNKIIELDEENLALTVEAGALLMDIAKFVELNELFYPPDPGEKSATIGGNISTNAGGMRALKYGVTRDYVLGLEVVLPSGEILNIGGKVVKNSSGYSLKELFCGSEGTLGIITKAILKLLPKPKKSISLLVPFPDLDSAIDSVPKILKLKIIPTAIEFMQKEVLQSAQEYLGKKIPDNSGAAAYLLFTFDGNSKQEIEKEYETVASACIKQGAFDAYIVDTDERKEMVWSARSTLLEAVKASTTEIDECDVVLPRNRIAEFFKYLDYIQDKVGIRIRSFGHAGDGNLHAYVLRDNLPEEKWKAKTDKAFALMYKKAIELEGLVSGEHGIGFAKKQYLENQYGQSYMELLSKIKGVFDPKNILNPGKVCQ